ncbi:MAG: selenide, water dikinase SelD, partial [Paracoccaceae bacterium]
NPILCARVLLLIGGGHTHALMLRMWGMKPLPGVRVTVINPQPTAPYSGMLPGFVAGHYQREDLDIDLVRLARFAGARLIRGIAVNLDIANRTATLGCGRVLNYHVASLDIGVTSDMPQLTGFREHAIPAKPLGQFARHWDKFRSDCAAGTRSPRAAIIGGGVAGVELALAMVHALNSADGPTPEIALIDRLGLLPDITPSRRKYFRTLLARAGVNVLENAEIQTIGPKGITFADDSFVKAELVVGAAGAQAQDWLQNSGLALHDGYVAVDETLRSLNTATVFAVGDCAHLSHAPRPKAGVFAVREAPVLFANLRAALSSGKFRKFKPQRDYLKLISLGEKSALAEKWGMMLRGPSIWRLKDRIDRKFMDQFSNLRPMSETSLPPLLADGVQDILSGTPLCGGCGAKVSGQALDQTLKRLPGPNRNDILSGPGDDAATLAGPDGSFQVISTDHLRAFSQDPHLMSRITAIHALGDIWAMGAEPQAVLANVTLPRLSVDLQQNWLDEIMSAAAQVFSEAGAAIVGGHSATGAELSIGFTVTGLRDQLPIGKDGARAGDVLILTKPIGTGVILAAEMALKARGGWVMAAFDSMLQSQGKVARVLASAHAMTDVTGFGLAGHLAEISKASDVGFELDLADIPFLDGAVELAAAGIHSSLYPDNRALAAGIDAPNDPRVDLLFDPQTAGGLLAAVSGNDCDDLMNKLNKLGCDAKVIGRCTDTPNIQRVI